MLNGFSLGELLLLILDFLNDFGKKKGLKGYFDTIYVDLHRRNVVVIE